MAGVRILRQWSRGDAAVNFTVLGIDLKSLR
jgi:hypothetical protein